MSENPGDNRATGAHAHRRSSGDLRAFRLTYVRFRNLLILMGVLSLIMAVHLVIRIRADRYSFSDSIAIGLLAAGFLVVCVGLIRSLGVLSAEANGHLERLAFHDHLTDVYNYRYLMLRLEEELARAVRKLQPLCVIYVDLDHFKQVNDRHGHQVGNDVLREVGRVLKSCVRSYDLVGRVGGDEFLAVLPDTPVEGARVVAERLAHAVGSLCHKTPSGEIVDYVRLSAGIGHYPSSADSVDALIAQADQAMFAAKRAGGGVTVADPGGPTTPSRTD